MRKLGYWKLDAYRFSIDFVIVAHQVIRSLPKGWSSLGNQMQRAATSIALNIAEGAGEYAPREKARIYRIAVRSAHECGAILDVAEQLGFLDDDVQAKGRELLIHIVRLLTTMIRNLGRVDR